MGELHLEIYIERMQREFDVPVEAGAPQVNYRETINKKANFDYIHKKQTSPGQFAVVIGFLNRAIRTTDPILRDVL